MLMTRIMRQRHEILKICFADQSDSEPGMSSEEREESSDPEESDSSGLSAPRRTQGRKRARGRMS